MVLPQSESPLLCTVLKWICWCCTSQRTRASTGNSALRLVVCCRTC